MVELDSSRTVIRRFHTEQNKLYPDFNKNAATKFRYDFLSYVASKVNPHLFVVDWQIPESEDGNVMEGYPTA